MTDLKKKFSLLFSPGVLLFLLCLLGYGQSLSHEFMMDDFVVLFGERGVANKSFADLFTQSQHIFFRPVGHIFLKACHALFQDNPLGYHAANLLLFWGICFLFYKIVFHIAQRHFIKTVKGSGDAGGEASGRPQLSEDERSAAGGRTRADILNTNSKSHTLALLTSLFYCVHPLNNMAVNYITASVIETFVFMLQLSFLGFLYYLDSESQKKKSWMVFSLACFVLSLFSHEMSVVLPLVVFAYAFFMKEASFTKAFRCSIPYWMVLSGYLFFRMIFFSLEGSVSGVLPFVRTFPLDYIASVMKLIYWYLSKLLYPHDFVFLWMVAFEDPYFKHEWVRLLCIIVVLFYLLFVHRKNGLVSFALSLFVIGLLPVTMASYTYFPFVDPLIEPHWFYFSSIGFFMLAACGFMKAKEMFTHPRLWQGLVLVYILFNLVLLRENNRHWKTQESYCRYWLSFKLANATPDYWFGKTMMDQQNYPEAIKRFQETIRKNRFEIDFVLADLGYAYLMNGEKEKALENLKFAIRRNPKYSVSWFYLGVLYFREGQWEKSYKAFQKAVVLYPKEKRYQEYFFIVKNKLHSSMSSRGEKF